jgi:AcrR family transcriptional regulator
MGVARSRTVSFTSSCQSAILRPGPAVAYPTGPGRFFTRASDGGIVSNDSDGDAGGRANVGRSAQGEKTRSALADALLELARTRDPARITVRELADAAGIDRQTFYHHFEDIYALIEYTYGREMSRILGVDDIDDILVNAEPDGRSAEVLGALKENCPELARLLLFDHARNPRGYFYHLVRRRMGICCSPALRRAGFSQEQIDTAEHLWTEAMLGIICDWLRDSSAMSADELVSNLEQTTLSAFAGMIARKDPTMMDAEVRAWNEARGRVPRAERTAPRSASREAPSC